MHSSADEQEAPVGLLAARVAHAGVRLLALHVHRAGAEAPGAVADVGVARLLIRSHALPGGVAGRRWRVDPDVALLFGAERAGRIPLAAAGAVALPRLAAGGGKLGRAHPAGVVVPHRDRHAAAWRRGERAAAAGARAGALAADAVDALIRLALAAGGAGLPVLLRAAPVGGGVAGDALGTVRVALTGVRAGAVEAPERVAVLDAGRPAAPDPVAGPGRVELVAGRAGGHDADDVARVLGAGPEPVAGAVGAAGGGPLVFAPPAGIRRAPIDWPAGPLAPVEVARVAGTGAGDVTAHAVGTVGGGALVVDATGGAAHLLAAAAIDALVTAHALAVGRALGEAGASAGVTGERRADLRRARLALPCSVAGIAANDLIAVAASPHARGGVAVLAAATRAVAGSVEATAGRLRHLTGARDAGRIAGQARQALPDLVRHAAALARFGAGLVTADALGGAEAGCALGPTCARFAVRALGVAGRAVGVRTVGGLAGVDVAAHLCPRVGAVDRGVAGVRLLGAAAAAPDHHDRSAKSTHHPPSRARTLRFHIELGEHRPLSRR